MAANQPSLADLRKKVNDLNAQYDAFFAGQPRISRDAALMDSLRDGLQPVVAALQALPAGTERDDILRTAQNNLNLYGTEGDAIRKAQAAGPDALEAHRLATWSTFTTRRYVRHFAGRARATRDLGLLNELIEDLKRLNEDVATLGQEFSNGELSEARTTVENSLRLYQEERTAIQEACTRATPEELADVLAQVANDQFQLYQDHFVGKARNSRRPDLLQRMVGSLQGVLDLMQSVGAKLPGHTHNGRNIETVTRQIQFFESELGEIRKARQESSFKDLVGALGQAANQVFEEYRQHFAGQDRRTRELARLSKLCDQLYEIAHQMDDLDRVREDEMNLHNLSIVLDNLRFYEREYDEVQKAQNTQSGAPAA